MSAGDVAFLLLPWEPSLLLAVAFTATCVLYLRGIRYAPAGAGRQILFWTGLLSLYISLMTGLDYYAQHLFYVHRLQQAALHHLGPLLIVLARPDAVLRRGLPRIWRRWLDNSRFIKPVIATGKWLNGPIAAPALFSVLTILWLIPAVHQAAMLNAGLYRLMNASMALNGLMFWHAVLNGRASVLVRMAMAIAVIPVQAGLGMMMIFASGDLYPVYALCGRIGELGPHADQQIGGAILWLSSPMMSLIALACQLHAMQPAAADPAGA